MAKKKIEKGSKIHLVTAGGKHVPATVTNVRKGDLVDLEVDGAEPAFVITSSPYDETGKMPDSWHEVEEDVAKAQG